MSSPARTTRTCQSCDDSLHDVSELNLRQRTHAFDVVIFGHSHVAAAEWRGSVLYLNPGSAGPRRFRLPVTLAILDISGAAMKPQIIRLI